MRVLLILLLGVLGACQSAPIAMDLGSPVVSNAQGAAREGVVPLRGVSRVSLHADRTLRMEPSCAQILKLAYSSNINYSEAIIGLRNRARVMGGNAIAVAANEPPKTMIADVISQYNPTDNPPVSAARNIAVPNKPTPNNVPTIDAISID